MAIVNMSKFNLFTFDSNRADLLHELQKFGYVHFVKLDADEDEDLKEAELENVTISESMVEIDEEIAKVKDAIDILRRYHSGEMGLKAMLEGKPNLTFEELEKRALKVDYIPVYEELKELAHKVDNLEGEEKQLIDLKEELANWIKLESPIEDFMTFERSKVTLGTFPKELKENLEKEVAGLEYTYINILNEGDEVLYLFTLTSNDEYEKLQEVLRRNSFYPIKLVGEGTPSQEIDSINKRLDEIAKDKEEVEDAIRALLSHLEDMEVLYEYLMNSKLRLSVSERFVTTEKINMIEGYIPTDMEKDFKKAIKSSQSEAYYLELEEAKRDDPDVPILLKNSKFTEAFDSLTNMYALPRYNEIDPTPFIAPFYLIFFGMMVADMGYGLLMLLGTTFVLKKGNVDPATSKFIRFFYYLSFSVIAWGAIYGSFFGDLLGDLMFTGLIDPAQSYQTILIVSIIFGFIHLFFGLALQGYMHIRDKQYFDALCDVGFWYMALLGGIGLILTMFISIPSIAVTISKVVMIIGLAGIFLTGGREGESIGAKLGIGVYELYGITGYVGDFVSYSRLMALGLSGGFISMAVNMIAGMLFETGIPGIVFGIIIIIGGQSLNVFLSLLGAYVHSSRLIYVEFFGKFYEGGGTAFDSFRNEPEYINLK